MIFLKMQVLEMGHEYLGKVRVARPFPLKRPQVFTKGGLCTLEKQCCQPSVKTTETSVLSRVKLDSSVMQRQRWKSLCNSSY